MLRSASGTTWGPFLVAILILGAGVGTAPTLAEVERRTTNNGNLVLEDIPEIPRSIAQRLNRFQNVRSARLVSMCRLHRGL
jgi:hypothetical protein